MNLSQLREQQCRQVLDRSQHRLDPLRAARQTYPLLKHGLKVSRPSLLALPFGLALVAVEIGEDAAGQGVVTHDVSSPIATAGTRLYQSASFLGINGKSREG